VLAAILFGVPSQYVIDNNIVFVSRNEWETGYQVENIERTDKITIQQADSKKIGQIDTKRVGGL
jgi:hypothetical protein